ncbi:MAG TPA: PBP1A family penicillin-binding protein, partial [Spirochaetia bacterium]|nr:PBP1A family penicillin-binding protein [Spirochaetia bacterium]
MKIEKTHIVRLLSLMLVGFCLVIGLGVGATFAGVVNNINQEDFGVVKMAEASKIYDIKGRLITELFAEQKREIVSINEMPPFLIQAILTREDRDFYNHGGFNFWSTARAAVNNVMGGPLVGASTITQQLAGLLYANRNERTIFRKIVELYYALQLEKKLSKDEILELYLNQMYFGHGCYGVEAASQFHFGHSVRDITPAEAVMLVIQLANWNEYSPRKNPVKARKMQETILNDMVDLGYIDRETALASFEDYWKNFDITKSAAGAFTLRKDLAPYFTMYVLQQLDEMVFGNLNVYQDGLEIYTTLNLDFQTEAEALMKDRLEEVNQDYSKELSIKETAAESYFVPLLDLLSLSYNMPHMHVDKRRHMINTLDTYADDINPTVDIVSGLFGFSGAKDVTKETYGWQLKRSKRTQVQGALISIDPYTGYIYAMVGGREFNSDNQINYATQAAVNPGSSFKPLFYSAALEERKITPSTILKDVQMYFQEQNGRLYIPNNYGDHYRGDVPARDALCFSLNIPAINVLQMIGFDSAISMASKLLGVHDPAEIQRMFPRYWSLALGIIQTSPLSMARAFSTFANGGKGIEPIAILYVKDRNGRIILEPEKERVAKTQYGGGLPQLIKPQTAYMMTDILQGTVQYGTISYAKRYLGDISYPLAGKTGTTQNWHDAWTVGYSPYFTTAVWFGFDKGGGSLGTHRTGATLAAPIWAKYMRRIHEQLDKDRKEYQELSAQAENELRAQGISRNASVEDISRENHIPIYWLQVVSENRRFDRPSGLVDLDVCTKSGLRPSSYCHPEDIKRELFYPETVLEKECTICRDEFFKAMDSQEKFDKTVRVEIDIPSVDLSNSDIPDPRRMPDDPDDYFEWKERNKD